MLEYGIITNSFIGNFGQLNKICTEKNVQYGIIKNPDQMWYNGFVGKFQMEAPLCDELFEKMIEAARTY